MKFAEKLTYQQKNLIILGAVVIITILVSSSFYFYMYSPKMQEIENKKIELDGKKRELENMKFLATELATAEQTRQRLQSELNKLEKGIKPEDYIPTLLTEIEKLAQETKTKISSIVPQEVSGSSSGMIDMGDGSQVPLEYKMMTLNIPLECTYESLKDFLDRLTKLPVIIVVNSLQLGKGHTIDPFFGTPVMSLNLPTTIYILPRKEDNEGTQQYQ